MEELLLVIADLERQEAELRAKLQNASTSIEAQNITNELNIVVNRLSEKREELRQLKEKQQQTQKQEEHSGGLKETIREIFQAVIPADKFMELVGPSDFSVIQQEFNQLIDQAVDEHNQALYAFMGERMEAKDAEIQRLTAENAGLETKLEEAEAKHTTLTEELDAKQKEIAALQDVIAAKDAEIATLREQLNRAPQTTVPEVQTKPSQSLQDRISETKSRIGSTLNTQRFRGKIVYEGGQRIEIPSIPLGTDEQNEQEETTFFRPEADSAGAEPVQQIDATDPAVSFPQEEDVSGGMGVAVHPSGVQGKSLEERVAALERAVFGEAYGEGEAA